jgi:hypothetical protein
MKPFEFVPPPKDFLDKVDPETQTLIYTTVNIYSTLLDEGRTVKAQELVQEVAEFLMGNESATALFLYYAGLCKEYSIKLTYQPPRPFAMERFKEALVPAMFKVPKTYEDAKYRTTPEREAVRLIDDVFLPKVRREDVEIAIAGGLQGIGWTFEENRSLQALWNIRDQRGGADSIKVTRFDLYDAQGIESYIDADGRKRFYEGPNFAHRIHSHKVLMGIGQKNVCFVYSAVTGKDKKGNPLRTLALDYSPVIKVVPVYKDVTTQEHQKMLLPEPGKNFNPVSRVSKKRFAHYIVYFNRNVIGDFKRYFTALPSGLAREISDYRKAKGQRPSSKELDFIEFLYMVNRTPVEINFLKLAQKIGIDISHSLRRVREILGRCYQTTLDLKFALRIETDAPKTLGGPETKDIIHLNPDRFPYLRYKGTAEERGED